MVDPGHVHEESCYSYILTCEKEEHIHTDVCYQVPATATPAVEQQDTEPELPQLSYDTDATVPEMGETITEDEDAQALPPTGAEDEYGVGFEAEEADLTDNASDKAVSVEELMPEISGISDAENDSDKEAEDPYAGLSEASRAALGLITSDSMQTTEHVSTEITSDDSNAQEVSDATGSDEVLPEEGALSAEAQKTEHLLEEASDEASADHFTEFGNAVLDNEEGAADTDENVTQLDDSLHMDVTDGIIGETEDLPEDDSADDAAQHDGTDSDGLSESLNASEDEDTENKEDLASTDPDISAEEDVASGNAPDEDNTTGEDSVSGAEDETADTPESEKENTEEQDAMLPEKGKEEDAGEETAENVEVHTEKQEGSDLEALALEEMQKDITDKQSAESVEEDDIEADMGADDAQTDDSKEELSEQEEDKTSEKAETKPENANAEKISEKTAEDITAMNSMDVFDLDLPAVEEIIEDIATPTDIEALDVNEEDEEAFINEAENAYEIDHADAVIAPVIQETAMYEEPAEEVHVSASVATPTDFWEEPKETIVVENTVYTEDADNSVIATVTDILPVMDAPEPEVVPVMEEVPAWSLPTATFSDLTGETIVPNDEAFDAEGDYVSVATDTDLRETVYSDTVDDFVPDEDMATSTDLNAETEPNAAEMQAAIASMTDLMTDDAGIRAQEQADNDAVIIATGTDLETEEDAKNPLTTQTDLPEQEASLASDTDLTMAEVASTTDLWEENLASSTDMLNILKQMDTVSRLELDNVTITPLGDKELPADAEGYARKIEDTASLEEVIQGYLQNNEKDAQTENQIVAESVEELLDVQVPVRKMKAAMRKTSMLFTNELVSEDRTVADESNEEKKTEEAVEETAESENNKTGENKETTEKEAKEQVKYVAFDIGLNNVKANEYDGFRVDVTLPVSISGRNFMVYHIHEGKVSLVDNLELHGNETDGVWSVEGFSFDTPDFSEFVLSYTVDFHWEVNGKVYEFSIPGGGFVSIEHLVEVLGIAVNNAEPENNAAAETISEEMAAEEDTKESDSDSSLYDDAITLNETVVSEETRTLVADIASVEFSDPDLVWIGKVSADSSVGELKKTNQLDIEYSAELTEHQIEKINAQMVHAGDWALISKKPFTSEETLTIIMKNGDHFLVNVTDAQISTHLITSRGDDFLITVVYGPDAGIPEGAELRASELNSDSKEYEDYYEQMLSALKREKTSEEVEADRAFFHDIGLDLIDLQETVDIAFARFFDISIWKDNVEIEPNAPVQVVIEYVQPVIVDDDVEAEVIHFAKDGIELIDPDTNQKEASSSGISVFTYEQASFSITGTLLKYTGAISEGKYIIIKGSGEQYYALRSDGSAYEISRNSDGVTFPNVPDDASWIFTKAGSGSYYIENDQYYSWLTLYNGVTGNWRQEILVGPSNAGKSAVYFKNPNNTPLRWNSTNKQFVLGTNTNTESFYIARVSSDIPAGQGNDLKPAATTGLGDLEAWKNKINARQIITDKSASVVDYDNRIYQIDLKAASDVSMLTHKIDLELITDTSRSMYFPATLQKTGYQFHKDRVNGTSSDSLTEVVKQLDKSKIYYFIGNEEQATVYALYFDGDDNGINYDINKNDTTDAGKWRFVDSSYMNPPDARQMNEADRINRLMGANIEDFKAKLNPDVAGGTMCSLYTSPDDITRLAYLKEAVRIASEIVYAADRDSRIGLVTFNKTASLYQQFTTYNNRQQLYSKIGNISLAGGTRQDLGLDKGIELFGNARQDADKIAVLITDGAPNMQYDDTTADSTHPKGTQVASDIAWGWISNKANNLKGTNSSYAKLYTLGLSMNMVGGNNSANLASLASNEDGITRHFNAENGNEIANAIKSLIETLIYDVEVEGKVTDALDPAFYPVDRSGNPIEPGTYYDENGKAYIWEKVAINEVEHWRVTYTEQRIGRGTRDSSGNITAYGWTKTFYAKAKEDFLGGNNIKTNSNVRYYDHVEAEKCIYQDRATGEEQKIDPPNNLSWGQFSTPYVNVDELHLTQHSNTWEVYIGSQVHPEDQLNTLWENIYVKQVVKDSGLITGDNSRIKNAEQKYYAKTDTSDTASPSGEPSGNYSAIHISNYVPSIEWNSWVDYLKTHDSKEETFAYSGYGHNPGTITVKLEKTIAHGTNAVGTAPGEHVTDVIGKPVETYAITVTYNPQTDHVANVGDTVTRSGEDIVKSENIHTINVIQKGIEITKVDGNGDPITGNGQTAQFTIYRAAKQGEAIASDDRLPEGEFTAVVTISTDPTTGKARWEPIQAIQNAEGTGWLVNSDYFILETQAPGSYIAYDKQISLKLRIDEATSPVLNASDGKTALLYNLTQTPTITVVGDAPATYVTDISETDGVVTFKVRNDMTADLTIIKTDNATTPKNIGGAVFKLTKDGELQKNLTVVMANDGTTEVTVDSETGYFTVPESGVIIKGLRANLPDRNYVLTEITPPDGYVITIRPIEFVVDSIGTVTDKPNSLNGNGKVSFLNQEYTIQNEPGVALPSTGGPGTNWIYLLGIMLINAAGIGLLTKHRRNKCQ
ncbi:MAG: VWA domain-containing protein [Clostridia bacterium]|nr:VWA domain-containing protein [Clostridia bacterium]